LKHNWLLVMEYTHIRYSDITTCIDSVSARAAQLEDRWSPNELCEGEQSHAYIIKHPIETQLTPCDGIHSHQVQWHYYVYWFCECQSSTPGGRMVSKWIVWGRAVSCLHNQAPNLNTIDSLWWNTLTSGTVTLLRVLILWVPEQHNWRTDGLQMNCVRESSPHAYIIKHPIETQLTPCDGIHSHQVQWHYYVYWFCECQSSTTGGQMVSKWIVWGRAVSCLHNQAPNWNTIDSLWWNTLTSGTVTLLRVLILWVPEQHNWRTDGLQMNCVRESSLMLT